MTRHRQAFLKSQSPTIEGRTSFEIGEGCARPIFVTRRAAVMRTETREGASLWQPALPGPAGRFTQACQADRLAPHAAGRRGALARAGCCRSVALLVPQAAQDCGITRAMYRLRRDSLSKHLFH
jgi:hypothetical protein